MKFVHLLVNRPFAGLAFVLVFLASCAKEGPMGPTGNDGPSFTGTVSGHATLYDQYGGQVLGYLNKVQLSLNGATPIVPDSTGLFSFASITTGSYTITAADSGYGGTVVTFNYVEGTMNQDIALSAVPVFSANKFYADTAINSMNDSLTVTFAADTRPRNFIIFVSNSPAVNNLPVSYLLAYKHAIPAGDTLVNLLVPAQDLYDAGFAPGSRVYFAEYSYVVNDHSVYEDPGTGKMVYYAVNYPIVDTALVP